MKATFTSNGFSKLRVLHLVLSHLEEVLPRARLRRRLAQLGHRPPARLGARPLARRPLRRLTLPSAPPHSAQCDALSRAASRPAARPAAPAASFIPPPPPSNSDITWLVTSRQYCLASLGIAGQISRHTWFFMCCSAT